MSRFLSWLTRDSSKPILGLTKPEWALLIGGSILAFSALLYHEGVLH